MGIITNIERGLDRAIGMFSPASEVKRILQRQQAEKARMYAAAKTTRSTGGWSPVGQDVNTLIRSSSVQIRNRSRQLVRDFAYFARAVDILVDYTVGTGVQLQSRVTRGVDADTGKSRLHTAKINEIENAWWRWMEEADASGRLHYHELEQLAKRQDVESGEFLFVKVNLPDKNRFLPFALIPYESDWLCSDYVNPQSGNVVDQGIEADPATGRVIAYHFRVPDGFNNLTGGMKSQRILAENVIHGFKTLRPGQIRGISPFTTAILLADDLHEYLNAEIDAAKHAAKRLAVVTTSDIAGFQNMRATTDAETGQRIEELENAFIEYLRPGETITFDGSNRPGDTFEPFTRLVLRMVAVSTGVTYELLTGDYNGINYSNLRGIRNDFMKIIAPLQQRHIRQFCQPVFRAFLDSAVQSGRISLPGYFSNPYPWQECTWQPPGVESIDPLREGKAYIDQINSLLRSPQEITASRGRDYEEVLNEIAEAKRMADARGLAPADVKTALANAPSAVDPATADSTKKREDELTSTLRSIADREQPAPIINVTVEPQNITVEPARVEINQAPVNVTVENKSKPEKTTFMRDAEGNITGAIQGDT